MLERIKLAIVLLGKERRKPGGKRERLKRRKRRVMEGTTMEKKSLQQDMVLMNIVLPRRG